MRQTFLRGLASAVVLVMAAGAAHAQPELERFQRRLEQINREQQVLVDEAIPPDQRALIDYGGFISINFLALDDAAQETHILRQYDLNGYLRVNLDNVHEFFLRARTSYRDWNAGDDFDGRGDDLVEPTLDRAYYRFDLARFIGSQGGEDPGFNIKLKGGRQLVHWGNGLTLSEQIDGGIVTFEVDGISIDFLAGRTRTSISDIDSSRPQFDNDTKRNFFGGIVTVELHPRHRVYVYGLVNDDENDDRVLVGAGPFLGVDTRFEYNSHYIGGGAQGSLTDQLAYSVEAVYQGGDTLSNSFNPATLAPVAQTRDDIEAWAVDVVLDYLVLDPNQTRLSIELLFASGDDDRLFSTTNTFGGNRPNTDDNAFNAFGLINTGLSFAPDASNLMMLRVGASTIPLINTETFKRMQVGVDLFVFGKLDSDAPINETTSDDRYLGFEADFFINWQVVSDVSIAMRYGVFFPGKAITTDNDPRHFFFTGITFAF